MRSGTLLPIAAAVLAAVFVSGCTGPGRPANVVTEPFPNRLDCTGPGDVAAVMLARWPDATGYVLGPAMREAILQDIALFRGFRPDADMVVAWADAAPNVVPLHLFKAGCHVFATGVDLERIRPVGEPT